MEAALVQLLAEMRQMHGQMTAAFLENTRWQQSQAHRGKPWDDMEKFRSVKAFSGQRSEWEEFHGKVIGSIKAKSQEIYNIIKHAENQLAEIWNAKITPPDSLELEG